MSPLILLLAGFAAVIIIIASIFLLRRAEDDPLTARIDEFASREEVVSIEEIELSMPISDRIFVPLIRKISDFIIRFTPQKSLEQTTRQLELAGNPRNMSAATFWMFRFGATILLGGLVTMMMARNGAEAGRILLWGFVGAAVGFMLPYMLVRSMADRRKQAIIKKLPDALDLMTICVDAGLTFNAAMQKVAEKWEDPLSSEFGRVIYEMQLGKSRRASLKDMSGRIDVPDVTSFIAAVLQAEQLGVGIGKVLRIQSEQMRVRRRQRAEEKAQQAPVKMTFPLVFLIFPTIFVVLLAPAGIQVARSNALGGITGG